MSKNLLKRISLASAMILCIQPLLGMENTNPFPEKGQPNITRPQVYTQRQMPFSPLHNQLQPGLSQGLERIEPGPITIENNNSPENQFNRLSEETNLIVLSYFALGHYYEKGHTKGLMFVCTEWNRLINDKHLQKYCQNKIFLNGKFTYQSDQGETIPQFIKDYENPFKIKFDLQQCASANRFCVVTTDPSVFSAFDEISDENKLMTLIITRSFAEENLETTTNFLAPIMPEWNKSGAPIGYFFKMSNKPI